MAKNLYRFSCPLVSEYDSETRLKGKEIVYVDLLPLDGFQQKPDKDEYLSNTNSTKVITYKTNNPKIFWKVP